MFTLTTSTGKKFDSDYAVTIPMPPLMYATILNKPFEEIVTTLLNPNELPFEGYEMFRTISGFDKLDNGAKIVLMP